MENTDLFETFKTNMKKTRVDGKPVGAYANINGFWGAITVDGDVDVFDTRKEASSWLKAQHNAKSEAVH